MTNCNFSQFFRNDYDCPDYKLTVIIKVKKDKSLDKNTLAEIAYKAVANTDIDSYSALQPDLAEPKYSELEKHVMNYYPEFQKHYPTMLKNGYFEKKDDGHLHWKKSKKCLAQYFGNQSFTLTTGRWKLVEQLFEVTKLQSSFSSDPYKKDSSDYVNLKLLLNIQ